MKYFFDTEFLEGKQRLRKTFLEALFATKIYTEPTIDLISIGIVAEDGREYYAISKEFNLNEAWNRFDLKYNTGSGDANNLPPTKVYWLRQNVLKPIFKDLWFEKGHLQNLHNISNDFTFSNFKRLIKLYGKSNQQIAKEVEQFCKPNETKAINAGIDAIIGNIDPNTEFYGYYSDYDWVVFCWLFGKMMDLPKGFPMYCKDLKQTFDEKAFNWFKKDIEFKKQYCLEHKLFSIEDDLKLLSNYPKQNNEHNALDDAQWNFKLFKFLETVRV